MIGLLLGSIIGISTYLFHSPNYSSNYENTQNPAEGLSEEKAIKNFDESYVWYLLFSIGAYNLHESKIFEGPPIIEISLENETFNAIVSEGIIKISKEKLKEKDIVIHSSKSEIVKMMNNDSYVRESFSSGKSTIELKKSESMLATKGYLSIYKKFS